jgi:dTDP-4-amino-4,6-dideoxygalactose transaminase
VDTETLDFDFTELEELPSKELLCIITSNLFGLVNNVDRVVRAGRARGAFVVDDAAQALGASRNGHFAGTVGDVGLYSFGRGKALTAIEGGLIVTNSDEIARAVQAEAAELAIPSLAHSGWLCLQMLAYSLFLHPSLYWVPNALPFLNLGTTEFAPGFPVTSMPALSESLLPLLINRLSEVNLVRRMNAAAITEGIKGNSRFATPGPAGDSQPTYIRFPVIARDEEIRNRAIYRLQRAGIGATPYYPSAICDIPDVGSHMGPREFHRPNAESLSRQLLTLPTHPFVGAQDLHRIVEILRGI